MGTDLLTGAAAFARPVLGRGEAPPSADPPAAAIQGLFWLTANLAAEEPLLIVADDAHWSDPASLRWLSYLAGRVGELPVALVIAARTGEPGTAEAELRSLATATRAIQPQPLSAASCETMLAEGLSSDIEPGFATACAEASGGNPFLLTELVAEISAEGIAPTDSSAERIREIKPTTVARAVLLRLMRFPVETVQVARAVAILGSRASMADTAALAQSDEEAVAEQATHLERAAVLARRVPLTFIHPIVREVLYEEISPPRRASLHRRAAEVLEARGADPEAVAMHVLATEPASEPSQVERLRAAALAAMAAGVPESAAAYLERALDEPPAPELRPTVLLELGNAEAAMGLPRALERVDGAIAESASGRERAQLRKRMGEMLFNAGMLAEAKRAFEEGLAEKDADDDPQLAAELETLRHAMAMLSGEPEDSGGTTGAHPSPTGVSREAKTHRALALVSACDDCATAKDLALGALEDGQMLRESGVTLTFTIAASCAIWCDALDEAEREIERALELVSRSGDLPGVALVRFGRSWVGYWRGALREALADAETSARAWSGGGVRGQLSGARYWQAISLLELDEIDAAEQALGLADDEVEPLFRGTLAAARGRLALARSDPELAWRELAVTKETLASAAYLRNPNGIAWRGDAVKALALLGDEREARRLADEDLALAESFGAPRGIGIALRGASLVSDPEPLLRRSVAALEGSPSRLELCRSLLELGAAVRRSGSPSQSREPLMRALDLAHELGAVAIGRRAGDELRAAGARPRRERLSGPESLTPSELRVAKLASDGRTNREISQQLFVSLRTVETHLTHTYSKLDITSRDQLAGALRQDSEAAI